MKMNKFSRYNHLFALKGEYILYNTASDGIIRLNGELGTYMQSHREQADDLAAMHPQLFQAMKERGMVTAEGTNEPEALIHKWQDLYDNPSECRLLLLPTLDCNLHCWYCYESHVKGSVMSSEVMHRICQLIDRKTAEPQLKDLHISWYGGEPLLYFERVVMPVMKHARAVSAQNGVRFTTHFTTNGVLLTARVRQALLDLRLDDMPTFQITLDGNREKHNDTRFLPGHEPTFDLIVWNIKDTLRAGMPVLNRFNYTGRNVDTLPDILKEYKDLSPEERSRLQFDFQQVWQEGDNKVCHDKALRIASGYHKDGMQVTVDKKYDSTHCREDSLNQVSINYDGSVYKCTGFDVRPELKEGTLTDDGRIEWNQRYYRRIKARYGNAACRPCSIFPICHGGCSQSFLSSGLDTDSEVCYKHYTETDKKNIIIGRLTYLLEHRQSV